ncbi:hypothetical protein MMC07_006302 [Pseudocyphellaria aurata]|nr:hypothetical protein [Pseudocyphellaria aurata]
MALSSSASAESSQLASQLATNVRTTQNTADAGPAPIVANTTTVSPISEPTDPATQSDTAADFTGPTPRIDTRATRRQKPGIPAKTKKVVQEFATLQAESAINTSAMASKCPGLLEVEIARIFSDKFRRENLYRLRHLKGRGDKDNDDNITIENGLMNLKRATGNLGDFGATWDIWSEAFINYTVKNILEATFPHSVMTSFFGRKVGHSA